MRPYIIPAIIVGIIVPVLFVGTYFGLQEDIGFSISESHIDEAYLTADRFYDAGEIEKAINSYQYILKKDESQEKAAHELGKIYNEFNQCELAVEHYEKHIEVFPESARIAKGYEMAQKCGQ